MTFFLARVELHRAPHDSDHYKKLHVEMQKVGFFRVILGDDGAWYHLPPAQYSADTVETHPAMLGKAMAAAVATGYGLWTPLSPAFGKTFAVIVTMGPSRWAGLPVVRAAQT